jgi:protein CpxP
MKSHRVKWIGGALVLLLLAAFAVAETAGMPRHHRGAMFGGFGFYAHQLDLTDAQRAQMKDILTKEKPAIQPLMQQMGQSRRQLKQLEMSGTFDEAQVRTLAAQQSQTMTELTVQRARIHSELLQVLTVDQKTKLTQLMAEREQKFKSHLQAAPQQQ